MASQEQCARLKSLARRADDLDLNNGLFQSDPGKGVTLADAAFAVWKKGLIAAPSVTALLEALEKLIVLEAREGNSEDQP